MRNLVTSLDATLATDGIRAVAVQVNGVLAKEGPFSPPQVAEALFAATVRPEDGWTAQGDPTVDPEGLRASYAPGAPPRSGLYGRPTAAAAL